MKQGASIDFENFDKPPWIILLLNYMMDKMDSEEFDGAIQPKNIGQGWTDGIFDKGTTDSGRQREEACTSVVKNND